MALNRYRFELARSPEMLRGYFALRQQIFCQEQGLFDGHDRDDLDDLAYAIVAIDDQAPAHQNIVGVVRIYEERARHWYGGRLGVHPDYRRGGRIGKGLIYKAVTTANGWGCDQFLATVQLQNVRFFQRLHWDSRQEIQLWGLPHHLMEADLAHYPPSGEPRLVTPPSLSRVS